MSPLRVETVNFNRILGIGEYDLRRDLSMVIKVFEGPVAGLDRAIVQHPRWFTKVLSNETSNVFTTDCRFHVGAKETHIDYGSATFKIRGQKDIEISLLNNEGDLVTGDMVRSRVSNNLFNF